MKTGVKLALFTGTLFGLVLGVVVTGLALSIAGENLILTEMRSPFDTVDKTVEVIENRIGKDPGWHVITTYDYNHEIVASGGAPIGKMKLIKFCSAAHASKMLGMDDYKKLGAMLPKTIAVYEKSDGYTYVSMPNGAVIGKMFRGRAAEIVEATSYEIEDIMRFMNFRFSMF